jgi:putative membrane protein insertion efficiency factor
MAKINQIFMKNIKKILYNISKRIIIYAIKIYQIVFSTSFGIGKCRFIPTCSCYAITALEKKGVIHGCYLAIKRICRCHPFYKNNHNIYDPLD